MGVIRARKGKASVLPREYGPLNWYNAHRDLDRKPFRFQWPTEILRKLTNASLSASTNSRSNYVFNFIQIPNRFLEEPVGYPPRAPSPVERNIRAISCNTWTLRVSIRGSKWLHKCCNAVCLAEWPCAV